MKPCQRWVGWILLALAGCAGPALRSQSPEALEEEVESTTRLVGDVAHPYGNNYVKIEAVALVTGLAGTGEDPGPSPQRANLLHELQARGVPNPNQVLASTSNAMVLVKGYLPPGVQKGTNSTWKCKFPRVPAQRVCAVAT